MVPIRNVVSQHPVARHLFIPLLQSISLATRINSLEVFKTLNPLPHFKVLIRVAWETDCGIGINKYG
jgi:hypothetical protein